MEAFAACFEGLEDPRTGNAERHLLYEILMIAFCTVLCGGQTAVDMALFAKAKEHFLRGFLQLKNGLPSHDTFSRVFRLLDPDRFRVCFQQFMTRFAESCQGVIAIDGKVLRRSFDVASAKSALHMVSAWGCEQRLVLAQIATDAKSNEITAVPKLLEMLSLKGNQGTLHADVSMFLDDPEVAKAETTTTNTTVDADHGRIETRTALVSTDIAWLQEQHKWPGLAAIGKIVRTREHPEKTTTETAYYLLSAPLSAERCSQVVRSHWGIENRLHWNLDVTMNEDQARNRKDNGPYNLAILRHMALNVMRKDKDKVSLRGKFKLAAWKDEYLAKLLAQI